MTIFYYDIRNATHIDTPAEISRNQVLIPQALTVHIANDASHLMLCIQRSVVMPSSELIHVSLQVLIAHVVIRTHIAPFQH